MDAEEIRAQFAYNRWAMARVLEAARALDRDKLARETGISHGSLLGTLSHIVWAEWLWLKRWQGDSPRVMFDRSQYPSLEAIASFWSAMERDQREFLRTLTGEQLNRRLAYENFQGQRWEYPLARMMQHVLHHSTYHRGQAVALLRQLGQTPPSTDFLVYVDEGGAVTMPVADPEAEGERREDIHLLVRIGVPVEMVFRAVTEENGLRAWWTDEAVARAERGSVAEFHFGDRYHNRMRIVQLERPSHLEWECIDGDREWVGTRIIFDLRPENNLTVLRFGHCRWRVATDFFASCAYQWAYYLGSLKSLCETGSGTPFRRGET